MTKIIKSIYIKPIQHLPIANAKVIPWNYNKVVLYQGKKVVKEIDEARGLTHSRRYYIPKKLIKGKMVQKGQVSIKKLVTDDMT